MVLMLTNRYRCSVCDSGSGSNCGFHILTLSIESTTAGEMALWHIVVFLTGNINIKHAQPTYANMLYININTAAMCHQHSASHISINSVQTICQKFLIG